MRQFDQFKMSVSDAVPSTSSSKSSRVRSIVHTHFDTKNKNDQSEVKCLLCKPEKWISYPGCVTSNLIAHLRVSDFNMCFVNIITISIFICNS